MVQQLRRCWRGRTWHDVATVALLPVSVHAPIISWKKGSWRRRGTSNTRFGRIAPNAHSETVMSQPPEPLVVHPLPPAPCFVGRASEVAALKQLWQTEFRG